MPLLTPQFDFRRIQEIPTSFFAQHGIRALLLDVDNTLTGDNSQEVKPEVAEWLARQQQAGLRLFVISNNREARVAPFAGRLGLGYIAEAEKPKTRVVLAKMKEFGVSPQQTALIGDQLFTDILCGNLCGCMTWWSRTPRRAMGCTASSARWKNRFCACTAGATKGGEPYDPSRTGRQQRKLYRHGVQIHPADPGIPGKDGA